jgi:hypothetical protein
MPDDLVIRIHGIAPMSQSFSSEGLHFRQTPLDHASAPAPRFAGKLRRRFSRSAYNIAQTFQSRRVVPFGLCPFVHARPEDLALGNTARQKRDQPGV